MKCFYKFSLVFASIILCSGILFADDSSQDPIRQKELAFESRGFYDSIHPKVKFLSIKKIHNHFDMTVQITDRDKNKKIILSTKKHQTDDQYSDFVRNYDYEFDLNEISKYMPVQKGDVVGYFKGSAIEWAAIKSFIINFDDSPTDELLLVNGDKIQGFCFVKKWFKNGGDLPKALNFIECSQNEKMTLTKAMLSYSNDSSEIRGDFKDYFVGILKTKDSSAGLEEKIINSKDILFQKAEGTANFLINIKANPGKSYADGSFISVSGKLSFFLDEAINNCFCIGNDIYSFNNGCKPGTDGCWGYVLNWVTGDKWELYP
jgi:hypothetical protein